MVYLKKIFLVAIVLFVIQSLYVAAGDNSEANPKSAVDTLYKTVTELYNSGVQCFMNKQYDKAVEIFSEVLKKIPSDAKTTEWTIREASTYLCRGMTYYRLDQYNKAISDFSCTIKLIPDINDAYLYRGYAYYSVGQYDKAIADLSHSIKLNPNDIEVYIYRGYSYYRLSQYEKAISDFSHSIKLNPNDKKAFYYRGMVYCETKQYDKAMEDFSIASEGYADFGRANVYEELKQYANAVKNYSQAIELWHDTPPKECPGIIVAYLNIMKICIITSKSDQFNYWLERFDKNISIKDLTSSYEIIKLYLSLINKCIINKSLNSTEKELSRLLKNNKNNENNENTWPFYSINEWLNNPKNGLTSKQKKYIQALTDKVNVASNIER